MTSCQLKLDPGLLTRIGLRSTLTPASYERHRPTVGNDQQPIPGGPHPGESILPSPMPLWYRLLVGAGLLFAAPWYLLRRGSQAWRILAARRHDRTTPLAQPGALWIHAVSVGEVAVAATLVRKLPADLPLLVTTVTPTGQLRARQLVGSRAAVTYLPLETPVAVQRFFDLEQPRTLVLVEGDYWPLVLATAQSRGVKIAAVNVRIGDRTFRRLLRVRHWADRYLFSPVACFGAQSELDRDRLAALGIAPDRIVVTGNLKYDAVEATPLPELEERILKLAQGRPILIAGSTMPGEELLVVEAFRQATVDRPAFLLLAPRHPERAREVETMVEKSGLRLVRRSRAESTESELWDGLLLDTVGELAALYRLGLAAFIGGTLVPTGGHNPIEPALAGSAIAVGPSLHNFRDLAAAFDRDSAWVRVHTAQELSELWRRWIENPEAARAQGQRGRAHVRTGTGAAARTLELLRPLDDRLSGPGSPS